MKSRKSQHYSLICYNFLRLIPPSPSFNEVLASPSVQEAPTPTVEQVDDPVPIIQSIAQSRSSASPSTQAIEISSTHQRKRRKKQRSSHVTRAPNINPWLSRNVWDHCPTLNLTGLRLQSRHTHKAVWSTPPENSDVTPRSSAPQQLLSSTRPVQLGGTRRPGPVLETVRSRWAAPQTQKSAPPNSQLGGNRPSGPVLDKVRSVWASQQPQYRTPSTSGRNNLN